MTAHWIEARSRLRLDSLAVRWARWRMGDAGEEGASPALRTVPFDPISGGANGHPGEEIPRGSIKRAQSLAAAADICGESLQSYKVVIFSSIMKQAK